jgi:hypothetical protein
MGFVADRIPKELRRIVEFLNEQMRPAELLAIEVEQFTGAGGLRLLAPRVVGATERAASAKAVQPPKAPLSEEQWLNDVMSSKGEAAATNARRLLDWFRAEGFLVGMTDSQDRHVRPAASTRRKARMAILCAAQFRKARDISAVPQRQPSVRVGGGAPGSLKSDQKPARPDDHDSEDDRLASSSSSGIGRGLCLARDDEIAQYVKEQIGTGQADAAKP